MPSVGALSDPLSRSARCWPTPTRLCLLRCAPPLRSAVEEIGELKRRLPEIERQITALATVTPAVAALRTIPASAALSLETITAFSNCAPAPCTWRMSTRVGSSSPAVSSVSPSAAITRTPSSRNCCLLRSEASQTEPSFGGAAFGFVRS